MIRNATEQELAKWDKLIAKNPDSGHIYQTFEWGEYKNSYKWRPLRLVFESGKTKIYFQLLGKNVRGMGRVYYCPKGPGFFKGFTPTKQTIKLYKEWTSEVRKFLSKLDRKALMLIVEPEALEGTIDMRKMGYDKFRHDLQFKATIIVDIDRSPDELIAGFKQKTRYNINLARRKGVKIERRESDKEMIDLMYNLMRATKKRARFFLRPKDAFAKYWRSLAEAGLGQFFVATYEGEVLAAEYVMIFNKRAYYKEGGSYSKHREVMAPHRLQYEGMVWAHEQGAMRYDMVAVPPKDRLEPKHPHYSLYQFKSGFEPEITEFVGCWSMVLNSRAKVWLKTERYYNAIYSRIKRNLFY